MKVCGKDMWERRGSFQGSVPRGSCGHAVLGAAALGQEERPMGWLCSQKGAAGTGWDLRASCSFPMRAAGEGGDLHQV